VKPGIRVLDFGCGCGLLGASLLQSEPGLDLTLLDSDAVAMTAAKLTLAENGLSARLLPSHGFNEVADRYDLIITNPPFHEGVRSDNMLVPRLFENLHRYLVPNGRLLLVANRHLPYHAWLKNRFRHTRVLKTDGRYQVIEAREPQTGN
jgi:16S rRNA (guanine1207-N2)-methyltransferase